MSNRDDDPSPDEQFKEETELEPPPHKRSAAMVVDDDDEVAVAAEEKPHATPSSSSSEKRKRKANKHHKEEEDEDEDEENEDDEEEEEDDEEESTSSAAKSKGKEGFSFKKKFGRSKIATVLLTGATAGDVLVGINDNTTKGAVLRVSEGVIQSWSQWMESDDLKEATVSTLSRYWKCSAAEAERRLKQNSCREDQPNHDPAGKSCKCDFKKLCDCPSTCKFVIEQPGVLRSYAEESGKLSELDSAVENATSLSWSGILKLLGKHTLTLHKAWWKIGPKSFQAEAGWKGWVLRIPNGVCYNHQLVNEEKANSDFYVVDPDSQIAIEIAKNPSSVPYTKALAPALLKEFFSKEKNCEMLISLALDCVSKWSPGELKAALQKLIRFGAKQVQLIDGKTLVPTPIFVASVFLTLMGHSGSFVPDLGLFSRGCTSAFKRLAVIMFEDAWPSSLSTKVSSAAVLGAALLCSRVQSWIPSVALVKWATEIAISCSTSKKAVDLCRGSRSSFQDSLSQFDSNKEPNCLAELKSAAYLLRTVRSFRGDEEMLARISSSTLKFVEEKDNSKYPQIMPIFHIIDQHAFRGIGHLLTAKEGSTFKDKFSCLFKKVTGINPRRGMIATGKEFEESITSFRRAQRLSFLLTFCQHQKQQLEVVENETYTIQCEMSPGVLASAVGPVQIKLNGASKRPFVCTLGDVEPEEEVVMVRPSRQAMDLYKGVTDEERKDVITKLRSMKLPLKSPLQIGQVASFNHDNSVWEVDGITWDEKRQQLSQEKRVVYHPAVKNPNDLAELHLAACTHTGQGVRLKAKPQITSIVKVQTTRVLLRSLALMRQQYSTIRMPCPALDGGKSGNEEAVQSCDCEVYSFLLAVACLMPGALNALEPPHFSIGISPLLRDVEGIISSELSERRTEKPEGTTVKWGNLLAKELMQHQKDAVADMVQRDQLVPAPHAHFVFLDTGSGKSLIALGYLQELKKSGNLPKAVLWVVPKPTLSDMLKLLRTSGADVCPLSIVGKGKQKKATITPYKINVASHDSLRTVVDSLVEVAHELVAVIDEADCCYHKTQRTSSAKDIAILARKVICMTATPMRDNATEGLAAWLSMCVTYPLSSNNWWVAANSMIAKQIDLGIQLNEETVAAPFDGAIKGAYLAELRNHQWLNAAKLVYESLDKQLVDQAEKHQDDGALLVGRDSQHVANLLSRISARGLSALNFDDAAKIPVTSTTDPKIVVIRKDQCRGYNWAIRIGCLITSAYPSNSADRHQMVGRLRRIGQKRSVVSVITVVMAGSIVELLHERHSSVDQINISLEQLGTLSMQSSSWRTFPLDGK